MSESFFMILSAFYTILDFALINIKKNSAEYNILETLGKINQNKIIVSA